jgi:1,2-dihydroxy-3-keto-5-methylthiopentene dioxygenase
MSRLTIYLDDQPETPQTRTEDPARIAAALAPIGVRFERWDLVAGLPAHPAPDAVLAAYRPHLDAFMGPGGAGTADVLQLAPGNPAYPAMRQKFLDEHTHTEDEVRFFVEGSGHFILHADGRVFDAECTAGDLISVPSGIPHWFDAGSSPAFTVLRVFTDTAGWTPHYTGDAISERFPAR